MDLPIGIQRGEPTINGGDSTRSAPKFVIMVSTYLDMCCSHYFLFRPAFTAANLFCRDDIWFCGFAGCWPAGYPWLGLAVAGRPMLLALRPVNRARNELFVSGVPPADAPRLLTTAVRCA